LLWKIHAGGTHAVRLTIFFGCTSYILGCKWDARGAAYPSQHKQVSGHPRVSNKLMWDMWTFPRYLYRPTSSQIPPDQDEQRDRRRVRLGRTTLESPHIPPPFSLPPIPQQRTRCCAPRVRPISYPLTTNSRIGEGVGAGMGDK
jgi:hypothetical protein